MMIPNKDDMKPVLGTFSKGNEYAVSLNFGLSAGHNCDLGCAHNPKNTDPNAPKDCYAVRVENRPDRKGLLAKLERHEYMSPMFLCGRAVREMRDILDNKGGRIDWLRISTNGALPPPDTIRNNRGFLSAFKMLMNFAYARGIPVHIPVETREKQEFYQTLIGDRAVVRESIHISGEHEWYKFITAPTPCSTSVGSGLKLHERIEQAKILAELRKAHSGRHTVVCPAVVSSFNARMGPREGREKLRVIAKKSKCGNCVACSKKELDIIYPAH